MGFVGIKTQLNLQMEAAAIGGSEDEANGASEYGEIVVALRK